MGTQRCVDDGQICLSAAHQEMDSRIRLAAGGADHVGSLGAVMVLAIAGSLLQVGGSQGRQHLLVTAFAVIVVKIDHWDSSEVFSLFYARLAVLSRSKGA